MRQILRKHLHLVVSHMDFPGIRLDSPKTCCLTSRFSKIHWINIPALMDGCLVVPFSVKQGNAPSRKSVSNQVSTYYVYTYIPLYYLHYRHDILYIYIYPSKHIYQYLVCVMLHPILVTISIFILIIYPLYPNKWLLKPSRVYRLYPIIFSFLWLLLVTYLHIILDSHMFPSGLNISPYVP